mmetsp:Transcript_23442/g.23216  ORF Transcript_23442/g.23216 Transcript_23442/m.23216 type:complete len:225 (+) Transcript_23442:3-677(+)
MRLARRAGIPLSSGFWFHGQTSALGLVHALTRYRAPLFFMIGSVFLMPLLFLIPFVLIFHPLDDVYDQAQLATYIVVSLSVFALLRNVRESKPRAMSTLGLAWFYVFGMGVLWVVFYNTAGSNLRYSYGQPFVNRDCRGEMEVVGWGTNNRERYLCPVKVDDGDVAFNIKCLETTPEDGSEWYWLCGNDITTDATNEILLRFGKAVVLLAFLAYVSRRSKKKSD